MARVTPKTSTQGAAVARETPSARGAETCSPSMHRPTVKASGPSTKADFNRGTAPQK